jgi:hypothetical protein
MRGPAGHAANPPFSPSQPVSTEHTGVRFTSREVNLTPCVGAIRAESAQDGPAKFYFPGSAHCAINDLGEKNLLFSRLLWIVLYSTGLGLDRRIVRRRTEVRKRSIQPRIEECHQPISFRAQNATLTPVYPGFTYSRQMHIFLHT